MATAVWVIEPFRGLRPFTAEESELFFGRDGQVKELLRRLANRRFLAVVGTSGSGKSSLVRAGLVPAIQRGYFGPTGTEWVIATIPRPGLDPIRGLAHSLIGVFGLDDQQIGVIESILMNSSRGLEDFAHDQLRPDQRLLVLVDQFEELFRYRKETGPEGRVRSTAFVKLLLHATGQMEIVTPAHRGPIYVVLTMRSDYLGDCAQFRGLPEALNDAQFLVPQMSRDQLREAIECPVALAMADISKELVDRLLNDVGNDPDMLPVLQHALLRIWEVSKDSRAQHLPMDVSHYDDETVRGIGQALNLDAEAAFSELHDPESQNIARRAFQRLVEPGAEDEETRRPTRVSEIAKVCCAPEAQVRGVLEVFLRRRFITLSNDSDPLVDISHESLIRLWQRLKRWVVQESQSASLFRRLSEDAVKKRALYRGPTLAEAVTWRNNENPNSDWAIRYGIDGVVFDQSIRFLRRSELRQWVERGIAIVGVLVVVALAVVYYSLYRNAKEQARRAEQEQHIADDQKRNAEAQREAADLQARRAEEQKRFADSRRLASLAELGRWSHSDLALLLSIEAFHAAPTFEARSAILRGLEISPGLLSYLYHSDPVLTVAFSPNGKFLASAGSDAVIRLWDVATRRAIGEPLRGHTSRIWSVVFTPDGRTIASASGDHTVRLWDVRTHKQLGKPLEGHLDEVGSVSFNQDGTILASGSVDGTVRLWEVATHRPLEDLKGSPGMVNAIAFSHDGKRLASGGYDLTVHLWDLATRSPLGDPLHGHTSMISALAFSPNDKILASGSWDNSVRLWDAVTYQPMGLPLQGSSNQVACVAFSPDGKTLATSGDWIVRLWNVETHQPVGAALQGHTGVVQSVSFSADGKTLASASLDKTVRIWDVATRNPISESLSARTAAFSPDGKTLALAGWHDTVRLWDLTARKNLRERPLGDTAFVQSLAFSPDGKTLALASDDKTVRLWDVATLRPIGTLGHTGKLNSVIFNPDGRTLASASDDKTVRLWDVATLRTIGAPLRLEDEVSSIAFSPDGKTLALASWDNLRLWDSATRRFWGKPLQGHKNSVTTVVFSSDGKTLASAGWDNTVRLWDTATQLPLGEPLEGHIRSINSVAFSPDGKMLVSGSDDNTVRLWDVFTRHALGDPLTEHNDSVTVVSFSPDGKLLMSSAGDGTVRLWPMDHESWIARTCSIVNRNLSISEWQQEIGPEIPYHKTCPNLPPGDAAPKEAKP
jgi:WD40 repeat protein